MILLLLFFLLLPANAATVTNGGTTISNFRNLEFNGSVTLTGNQSNGYALVEIIDTDSGGTVTSVAISGTNGMLSTGGPITTSGTIDIALDQGQVLVPSAIGSTVQAWDEHLDDIAAITPGAENRIIVADGLGGWSVAAFSSLDTNTNASTICSGSTTYLDGEGNCDDISSVYQAASANLTTLASNDGSNLTGVDAATLDTVDSTSFLRSDANDTFSAATLTIDGNGAFNQSVYFDAIPSTTATTTTALDWRLGNKQKIDLAASITTFNWTAPAGPTSLQLQIVQNGTSNTVAFPAAVQWPAGTAPTITAADTSIDWVSCVYDGTNYFCTASQNFQ